MTDNTPALSHGDEYIVRYSGGPSDGQTDRRISTDGAWDDTITVLAAVDGKETLETYTVASWREVGGTYHVSYVYDESESEAAEDPEDRGGRQ